MLDARDGSRVPDFTTTAAGLRCMRPHAGLGGMRDRARRKAALWPGLAAVFAPALLALTLAMPARAQPALTGGVTLSTVVTASPPWVTIGGGLGLTASNPLLTGATVKITGGFQPGDTLTTNTAGVALSAAYDSATGVLTLSGSDTLADYHAILNFVAIQVAASSAANTSRTISFQASDANGASNTITSTVNIVASSAVTEFSTPDFPFAIGGAGIAAGPDNNLWFGEYNDYNLGRITTAGSIRLFQTPNFKNTTSITAGPNGALWFLYSGAETIGESTTLGNITDFSVSGDFPVAIAAGSDGALWFTDDINNMIGRLATNGTANEYGGLSPNSSPSAITAGPDGALWFVASASAIGRITTSGSVTEYGVSANGEFTFPTSIAVGSDGALWFTEQGCLSCTPPIVIGPAIGRITTSGTITRYPIPSGDTPYGIVAGPDGALWFAEAFTNQNTIAFPYAGQIGRVTTGGAFTEFPIPSGNVPSAIVAGPDGAMWFTEASNIGRFDITPETLTVGESGSGAGQVTSSPAGIDCGAGGNQCSTSFAQGTEVTLTAAASGGSTFAGWSGGKCNGTGTCTVTMSDAAGVTADFIPQDFTLAVSTVGKGVVGSAPAGIDCGKTCRASFAVGSEVRLIAYPDSGWKFDEWRGACHGKKEHDCHVTMDAAKSVIAKFEKK